MEHEKRGRMGGEMYRPGERMAEGTEEFLERTSPTMREAQREMERTMHRGRQAVTATRERMADFGESMRVEPRMLWIVGAFTAFAAAIAALMFFAPREWRSEGRHYLQGQIKNVKRGVRQMTR